MAIFLFVGILFLLILSHELGHFLAAKKAGVKVEEFGIGFPPRLLKIKKGETLYSINLIPVGGFVKIFGENSTEETRSGPERERSLANKSKTVQAAVLLAGVTFNLLLAWAFLSVGLAVGLPASIDAFPGADFQNPKLLIVGVLPGSPAERGGLRAGDEIVYLKETGGGQSSLPVHDPEEVQNFVSVRAGQDISVGLKRGKLFGAGEEVSSQEVILRPETGVLEDKAAIGVSLDRVGLLKLGLVKAVGAGASLTGVLTVRTVEAFYEFAARSFQGESVVKQITGPVGLAGLIGEAAGLGLVYLLALTAFISINLAVINLIPFPALDGGRVLFLAIEAIKGSPIKPAVANAFNLAGFALLILLMIVVTYNDFLRLGV